MKLNQNISHNEIILIESNMLILLDKNAIIKDVLTHYDSVNVILATVQNKKE